MQDSLEKIHFRGDLGNQALQASLGLAIALEQNTSSVSFVHNSCLLDIKDEKPICFLESIFAEKLYIEDDSKGVKKTKYWQHGAASYLSKHRTSIIKFLKPKSFGATSHEALVYIPSLDLTLDEKKYIFQILLLKAVSDNHSVALFGQDHEVIHYLFSKFCNFNINTLSTSSPLDDWRHALKSKIIYSVPTSFVYAINFFNSNNCINILHPLDFCMHKHFSKEYIFLCEMKKASSRIRILDPTESQNRFNTTSSVIDELSLCDYILSGTSCRRAADASKAHSFSDLAPELPRLYSQALALDPALSATASNQHSTKKILLNIKNTLMKILDECSIDLSVESSRLTIDPTYFLTAKKDNSDIYVPPILEQYGFSAARHFLFNALYLKSIIRRKEKIENSNLHELINSFLAKGYCVIPNVFEDSVLNDVLLMFDSRMGSLSKAKESLLFSNYKNSSIAKQFMAPEFLNMLQCLTGYSKDVIINELIHNTFLQTVQLLPGSPRKDPQQNYHLDTFFPAFKFWYFPYAVDNYNAPFQYAEGSHLPSKDILKFLYNRYLDNAYDNGYAISPDNREGSLRATDSDVRRMNLHGVKVTVPSNSLVIANVGGFHRRSVNTKHVIRHSIHSSIRPIDIFSDSTYL